MRISKSVEINDPAIYHRLLAWAGKFDVFCLLNSNRQKQLFTDPYSKFDFLLAVGSVDETGNKNKESETSAQSVKKNFAQLNDFYKLKNDWLFGFLSYDLKNEIESLFSENEDRLEFPIMHFFQPRLVLKLETSVPASGQHSVNLEILYLEEYDNEKSIEQFINQISRTEIPDEEIVQIATQPKVTKEEYILTVNKIKEHIQRGDIYEMNYCVEYSANGFDFHPVTLYSKLNELSPMPFSSFYRNHDQYLVCASPERFLAGRREKIISQPMKGTIRRGITPEEDKQLMLQLKNDPKERSENVMIVDLVRNDLSHTATKGSVKVEELFGVYTFGQLHQMISTVVSEKKNETDVAEVIRQAFPMGSMTGAPKIKAMQLIEQFEKTKRGIYSGSVGYLSPDGDFDFNVVIRSILCDVKKKYLSFMVGSAITANSVAEKEYEECLLKAAAMLKVLMPEEAIRQVVNE